MLTTFSDLIDFIPDVLAGQPDILIREPVA
jgi:hypothetical protein